MRLPLFLVILLVVSSGLACKQRRDSGSAVRGIEQDENQEFVSTQETTTVRDQAQGGAPFAGTSAQPVMLNPSLIAQGIKWLRCSAAPRIQNNAGSDHVSWVDVSQTLDRAEINELVPDGYSVLLGRERQLIRDQLGRTYQPLQITLHGDIRNGAFQTLRGDAYAGDSPNGGFARPTTWGNMNQVVAFLDGTNNPRAILLWVRPSNNGVDFEGLAVKLLRQDNSVYASYSIPMECRLNNVSRNHH